MAEQKAFDKTRAARRRLALLVLSGDQPAPATPCPEPTELAALVEGRLEPAREETCLAHLAGCDRCCALWLQLDRHRQEQAATGRRGRLLRLIGRPRTLTVAGSLLAAAASVALVLTLTLQADRTTLTRQPEQSVEKQSRATPAADSAVLAKSGENPVAAVPPPATANKNVRKKTAGNRISAVRNEGRISTTRAGGKGEDGAGCGTGSYTTEPASPASRRSPQQATARTWRATNKGGRPPPCPTRQGNRQPHPPRCRAKAN